MSAVDGHSAKPRMSVTSSGATPWARTESRNLPPGALVRTLFGSPTDSVNDGENLDVSEPHFEYLLAQ